MLCNLAWHMVFICICLCTGYVGEIEILKYVGVIYLFFCCSILVGMTGGGVIERGCISTRCYVAV